MSRLHDRIREILESTPGLTQKGLAERMGLNPAAVNRMLYGRRNIMAEEIPMIEEYLGAKLTLTSNENVEYRQDVFARRGFSDVPARGLPAGDAAHMTAMVPVYGRNLVTPEKGVRIDEANIVDWVTRHPAQIGIANAFAIYVFLDTMEPRYYKGELVYIHPGRPPESGKDCVIEMKSGDTQIMRFIAETDDVVRAAQLKPPTEKSLRKNDIKAIYAVIGRG